MKQTYFLLILFCLGAKAQIVNIPDISFKTELINHQPVIDTNADGEIQVEEALATTVITIQSSTASNLTGLNAFSNLTSLTFNFNFNMLGGSAVTTLNVTALSNLQTLICENNSTMSTINISGLTNLTKLDCSYSGVQVINSVGAVNLETLDCSHGVISTFSLTQTLNNTPHLKELDCRWSNNLSTLNLSGVPELKKLFCENNEMNALDVSALPNLELLYCKSNYLTQLDLSGNHHLTQVDCSSNPLTSVDFSGYQYQTGDMPWVVYNFSNSSSLVHVNAKVGMANDPNALTVLYLNNCPNLRYICANESQVQTIATNCANLGMPLVQVNSYCSFNPGGSFNTIDGKLSFDLNANGCDAADVPASSIKMRINDGTDSGITYTASDGQYRFLTVAGNFTVTPEIELPYFSVTPVAETVNFLEANSSIATRHFCLTPVGTQNDVEISLLSIVPARPGFDSQYKLIYKNKGNQIAVGNISLAFDDSVLDLVTSNPATSGQTQNNLNWNFDNLLPFETRTINLTLNVNSPMEIPAVNINDVLHFNTDITLQNATDANLENNSMTLAETVVGSFDPNDKTCLEGNFITPEAVGKYMHYLIRFQNSGTAAAENIVVKDIIDTEKFDIESFELIEASHPGYTKITGNKVEFVFEGINLPAESVNEPESHGFVAFKIKTKNTLVLGDSVTNIADIYFDYNFPIVTDPATTTIALLANPDFKDASISVHPNPVKSKLQIKATTNIHSIQLFDLQGRLIRTTTGNETQTDFDMSENATGIYLVKITTAKGVKIEKIIKE